MSYGTKHKGRLVVVGDLHNFAHKSTIYHQLVHIGAVWCYNVTKPRRKEQDMPRLSITLTDQQAAALERIAAETGATKQSMIGLAITAWVREYDAKAAVTPEETEQPEPERAFTVVRTDAVSGEQVEVAWLRGRWESEEHAAILCTASKLRIDGQLFEMGEGRTFRYKLAELESAVEGPSVNAPEFRQWAGAKG